MNGAPDAGMTTFATATNRLREHAEAIEGSGLIAAALFHLTQDGSRRAAKRHVPECGAHQCQRGAQRILLHHRHLRLRRMEGEAGAGG